MWPRDLKLFILEEEKSCLRQAIKIYCAERRVILHARVRKCIFQEVPPLLRIVYLFFFLASTASAPFMNGNFTHFEFMLNTLSR